MSECIFCRMAAGDVESERIADFEHCYVIKDQFPVSKGHLLLISRRHVADWFTAEDEIQRDILQALQNMKVWLDEEYQPDGYNIGINCRKAAGQMVMHLHVHLIPRYEGDVENPQGGVRGVIPSKQKY